MEKMPQWLWVPGYVGTYCMCLSYFIKHAVFPLKIVVATGMWPPGWLIGNMLVFFFFFTVGSLGKKNVLLCSFAKFYDVNIFTVANLIY